jgi:high-affinity Fe2+/Pb2+ permease
MNYTITTTAYIIYLPIVLVLTWYVAHTLFANAKVFMLDIFNGKQELAFSTNKLFEVGFYLINVGFALLIMKIAEANVTTQGMFEILSTKIGGYAIYLGIMLFANLYMFFRGRRASRLNRAVVAIQE